MRRGLIATFVIGMLLLLGADTWLIATRQRYRAEIDRLRASMTDLERARADEIVRGEAHRLRTAIELVRRQARVDPALHLSVALDSSTMYLEREGAMLRAMPVEIGPERLVGVAPDTVRLAAPRGIRTLASILADTTSWEVPGWIFADRGEPMPAARSMPGALGPVALVLDGGTIIYSLPASGPLADSTYVLPGAVRARADDLRALLPNLQAGLRVFFY